MTLKKLAYSLGRNDEEPNIELAAEIVNTKDRSQVKELIEGLSHEKSQIANDCIKVLYEIGYKMPELIKDHAGVFIKLLKSKNNRLVWGAMTALAQIASLCPGEIFENFETIKKAYETGSVITVDSSITVFAELSKADKQYEKNIFPIILKHLETCRPKEVPQHSERAVIAVNSENAEEFSKVLKERMDILSDPQRKRVQKVLKQAESLL